MTYTPPVVPPLARKRMVRLTGAWLAGAIVAYLALLAGMVFGRAIGAPLYVRLEAPATLLDQQAERMPLLPLVDCWAQWGRSAHKIHRVTCNVLEEDI